MDSGEQSEPEEQAAYARYFGNMVTDDDEEQSSLYDE